MPLPGYGWIYPYQYLRSSRGLRSDIFVLFSSGNLFFSTVLKYYEFFFFFFCPQPLQYPIVFEYYMVSLRETWEPLVRLM